MTDTNKTYLVRINGQHMGEYEGIDEASALCACFVDAGYASTVEDGIVICDEPLGAGDPSDSAYSIVESAKHIALDMPPRSGKTCTAAESEAERVETFIGKLQAKIDLQADKLDRVQGVLDRISQPDWAVNSYACAIAADLEAALNPHK